MTVWISDGAVTDLLAEADAKAPLETGGILLGYIAPSNNDVVITAVIGPGPDATHARHSFNPDAPYQERELALAYEHSGRRHTYLGDWHSHPSGSDDLSPRDHRTLRRIARSKSARADQPVMLIAHGCREWELTPWQLQPRAWLIATPTRRALKTWIT